jgi:hypothetical protein
VNQNLPRTPKSKRRDLAPLDHVEAKLGPKMQALNEKQRNFVIAMFTVRQGRGAAVRAARLSGWGQPLSSAASMATIGSRLMHNDAIIEAMREYGEQFLKGAAPAALLALEKLILTPGHKGHERAVSAVVDRLYPAEIVHNVKHEHTHDATPNFKETAQVLERIAELAAKFSVRLPAPPLLIDAQIVSKSERAT